MAVLECPDCGRDLYYVELEYRVAAVLRDGDRLVVRWWDAEDVCGGDGIFECENGHKHGTETFDLEWEILPSDMREDLERWEAAGGDP